MKQTKKKYLRTQMKKKTKQNRIKKKHVNNKEDARVSHLTLPIQRCMIEAHGVY